MRRSRVAVKVAVKPSGVSDSSEINAREVHECTRRFTPPTGFPRRDGTPHLDLDGSSLVCAEARTQGCIRSSRESNPRQSVSSECAVQSAIVVVTQIRGGLGLCPISQTDKPPRGVQGNGHTGADGEPPANEFTGEWV